MKKLFKLVWKIWLKIGEILGWLWTRILLTFAFILIIGSISIILKLFGKDPLQHRFGENSYWLKRPIKDLREEDYYHQF